MDQFEKKNELLILNNSQALYKFRLLADLYISIFFWSFNKNSCQPPLNNTHIIKILKSQDPKNLIDLSSIYMEKEKIKNNFHIFHWFLEFPDVFGRDQPGFDVILANPPWDTIQLDEREFFKTKCPEIAEISKQNQRRLKIKSLKTENLDLHSQYSKMMLKTKKEVNFIKLSPFYRNSSHGNLTTYPMFIERIANILAPNGFFSVICPTTFLLSDNLKEFVKLFIQNNALNSYFDFENKKIFPIDSRFHFLITSGLNPFIKHPYQKILASFMQESPNRVLELIQKKETITNSNDLFLFEPEDYTLFNPNTGNSPVFNSRLDYEILKRIYNKVPILLKKGQNSEINSYKINTTRIDRKSVV
mgnify:CR=1 FL=1